MIALYSKIIVSDVIIFGTPVYWYGPTAAMKGFIDRFVYFNCEKNRKKIRGKAAVIAVPFEDSTYETADLLVQFFEKSFDYLEIHLLDTIVAPGVTKRGEVRNKESIMNECFMVGKKLARGQQGGVSG